MKGKETTTEYKGKDALFESADYSYYELGATAPAYYKELTVNENGSYSFGKTTATEKTVKVQQLRSLRHHLSMEIIN